VQLFDRLSKGDDMITAIGEYPAYILFKSKGAKVEFVAPPDGLVTTPLVVGAVSRAPHPEASKLFVDWAMSKRGQAWYQSNPNLYYGSVRTDAPAMPTGVKLSDFKLLYPSDWDEYASQSATFLKEWNSMLGL
jgi:iron(III) transport system substrate-binding protein